MIDVALVTEQLRRTSPGGIGRYASCLREALAVRPDVRLTSVQGRLPTEIVTRLWSVGVPRRISADVMHATSFAFPCVVGRARTTVFVHDVLWRGVGAATLTPRGRRFHDAGLDRAIARAERLFVPSRAVRDVLVGDGVTPKTIVVTGEGADHLPVLPRSVSEHVLLCVGTLEPRKNLPRLLAAFDSLRRTMNEPVALRIVGSAAWRGQSGLPDALPDGVEVVGAVTDGQLAELLASATAFVYPSMGEGFGLPPVEAMRAGVPVVCSPMPSVRESCSAGDGKSESVRSAFESVDPTDVASIAAGMARVLGSADLRDELAARGRDWIAECTWANAAQRHVDAWEAMR